MKRFVKISSFFIIMVLLLTTTAFAETATNSTAGNASDDAEELEEISSKIGQILNVMAWIGYAIALGMLIFVGIKYMMSAANERADVKKGLVNYIIGIIIIGSAALIANIVSTIAMGNTAKTHHSLAEEIVVDTGAGLGGLFDN